MQKEKGTCNEIRWATMLEKFTESKAPQMSIKVVTKNSMLLKAWYICPMEVERLDGASIYPKSEEIRRQYGVSFQPPI